MYKSVLSFIVCYIPFVYDYYNIYDDNDWLINLVMKTTHLASDTDNGLTQSIVVTVNNGT